MRERRSTRVPFNPNREIGKEDLISIIEAAQWSPTPHNMQNFEILVIDNKDLLRRIGRITSRISEDFLKENYKQLSFSKEELLQKKVGILGTMFLEVWRDPSKFHEIVTKGASRPLNLTVQGAPTIILVLYDPAKRAPASEGDFLGILGLGCVLENMWLASQSLGIAFQVMAVFGEDKISSELRQLLSIPEKLKIAYAIRIGFPLKRPVEYVRVRRAIKSFTHYNSY